jgi:hypothetical protein
MHRLNQCSSRHQKVAWPDTGILREQPETCGNVIGEVCRFPDDRDVGRLQRRVGSPAPHSLATVQERCPKCLVIREPARAAIRLLLTGQCSQRSVWIAQMHSCAAQVGVCLCNTSAHDPGGLRIERGMMIDLAPDPLIDLLFHQIPAEGRLPIQLERAPDYGLDERNGLGIRIRRI